MTRTEALISLLLVVAAAAPFIWFWIERRRRVECLQQLATEYGGKCYRDPSFLMNSICQLRHNGRDYYVAYRPEQGTDGADLLLFACKVITPFKFSISNGDRAPWWQRITRSTVEEWPRVQVPEMDPQLIFFTPEEELLRKWLNHQSVRQAIDQLMNEMSEIRALGNELQVRKAFLHDNTDPAKIKGWISQIDHVAENLRADY